jgi:general secretion pathway protein H
MTPISAPDKHPQRGFTLLELLLVLSILAMLALLIGPGLNSLDSPSLNAQAREAAGLLNYARRMAVVEGRPTRVELVEFNEDSASDQPARQPPGLAGRFEARDITIIFTDSTGQQSSLSNAVTIEFYPEGGSTGGVLEFSQRDRRVNLEIDPFSGRVRRANND